MKEINCLNCGYVWKTKSQLLKVSCPSCGNKVKVKDIKKWNLKICNNPVEGCGMAQSSQSVSTIETLRTKVNDNNVIIYK